MNLTLTDRLARLVLSAPCFMLWMAMGDPRKWELDMHHATYKLPNGKTLMLWTANGAWWLKLYERGDASLGQFIGLFDRHVLWRRFKWMQSHAVVLAFTGLER